MAAIQSAFTGTVPADPWLPADNGFLASAGDMDAYLVTGAALTAGTLYLAKISVRSAISSAGHVVFGVAAAGVGASTGTFAGVYSSSGTLLSGSADIAASLLAAPAVPLLTLTTPVSVPAGGFVWAAIVVNLATTQPGLYRSGGAGTLAVSNANLAASVQRFATNGTLLVALPGSITPASNSSAGALPIWAALAA